MSKLLLNKRKGPFHLPPLKAGGKPRVWGAGTTLTVEDDEAKKLLGYHDVVEIKDGEQARKAPGAVPVPAGTGVSGEAVLPEADKDKKEKTAPAAKK